MPYMNSVCSGLRNVDGSLASISYCWGQTPDGQHTEGEENALHPEAQEMTFTMVGRSFPRVIGAAADGCS